jgi:hypothetical protein
MTRLTDNVYVQLDDVRRVTFRSEGEGEVLAILYRDGSEDRIAGEDARACREALRGLLHNNARR